MTPPLLDSITYLVLDDAARIPALQNNTIDAAGLATLDEMHDRATHQRASPSGVHPALSWYHFTFNGADGIDPGGSRRCGWPSPRASTVSTIAARHPCAGSAGQTRAR